MKYATAGFVIYGAPMDQASFWTMKREIRVVLQILSQVVEEFVENESLNFSNFR